MRTVARRSPAWQPIRSEADLAALGRGYVEVRIALPSGAELHVLSGPARVFFRNRDLDPRAQVFARPLPRDRRRWHRAALDAVTRVRRHA